ncbi:MAG TPA: NAD(+)/NADH kinase [Solirubrobacteraceae bacterium]|jgi:NAD+ kinase|nr:NAD(+)/NADH kinase [Solirubrobacteraceae bacterium]
MPSSPQQPTTVAESAPRPRRVGILVHPTRNLDEPLRLLREWTQQRGIDVVQIGAPYPQRPVAAEGDPADCDLIVSIGGDGTTLAALRAGAVADRPVLGIACGSLGALANVSVPDAPRALERFTRGEWHPRSFPALSIARADGDTLFALNDLSVVRGGGGQVRLTALVDGTLFARMAGDGAVVSTPIGTSGYAISAGGPLFLPQVDGFVLTPLPHHGGFAPPLVIGSVSELVIDVAGGFAGARVEVDGQVAGVGEGALTITFRPAIVTQVSFDDQEPLLAGLRRRQILLDSPRLLAESGRDLFTRHAET